MDDLLKGRQSATGTELIDNGVGLKEEPVNGLEKEFGINPNDLLTIPQEPGSPSLDSEFAEEAEKAAYETAYGEYVDQGLIGGRDTIQDTLGIEPKGFGSNYANDQDTAAIIRSATVAEDSEKAASLLESEYKSIRRERKVAGLFQMYQGGTLSYEDFLLRAYGKDLLEYNGYYTDSVVYWKSEFRKGNYGKHPLDNQVLRSQFIAEAENLFSLESFYSKLTTNDTSALESMVGEVLDEEGYKTVFGDSWEQAIETLGDYETAVKYYKSGYLGDLLNGLVYAQYEEDADGNQVGVGDPIYYVSQEGKLLRVVDRQSQSSIDESKEIWLYKNADGTADRLSFAENTAGEFLGALADGFFGAILGVVDIINMGGSAIVALFQDGKFKEDYVDNFTWWESMRSNLRVNAVKDLDGKSDADNILRGIGTAIGYVSETVVEIALSAMTFGAYSGAKVATKAASETVEAGVKKMARRIASESAEAISGKITQEIGEKMLKEIGEDVIQKASKEVAEKITKEVGEDVVKKFLTNTGEEAFEDVVLKTTKEMVSEFGERAANTVTKKSMYKSINGKVMNEFGQDIITNETVALFGGRIKKAIAGTGNVIFKTSNQMKMLNSGSVSIFKNAAQKAFGKTWGTTIARSGMNAALTTLETYTRAGMLARSKGEEMGANLWANASIAGAIAGISTMMLSSSTEDLDNIARFQLSYRKKHGFSDKLVEEVSGKLQLTSIGREVLKRNTFFRLAGGVSELMDNVITAATRMGFSSTTNVKEGFNNSLKNALSIDVLAPAILSSSMATFGRNGILGGKGRNEGSWNMGAVSAAKDLTDIYNGIDSILFLAKQAAVGTAEYEVLNNMHTKFRQTYAQELIKVKQANPNDGAAELHARLNTLEIIGQELSGKSDDLLSGFNNLAKKVLEGKDIQPIVAKLDEQTKAMLPKDIITSDGKLNGEFDFKKYIGTNLTSAKASADLDMYKFVADVYEAKTLKRSNLRGELKQQPVSGYKAIINLIKTKALDMINPVGKAYKVTDAELTKSWYNAINQAGFNEATLKIYLDAIGEHNPHLETLIQVENNDVNKNLSEDFDKFIVEKVPFEEFLKNALKKDYDKTIELLIANGLATDEITANKRLGEINLSKRALKKITNPKDLEKIMKVKAELDKYKSNQGEIMFTNSEQKLMFAELEKLPDYQALSNKQKEKAKQQIIKNSKMYSFDSKSYNLEVKQREAFQNTIKLLEALKAHDDSVPSKFVIVSSGEGKDQQYKIIVLSDGEQGDIVKDYIKTTQKLKNIFVQLNAMKQETDLKNKFLNFITLLGITGYSNKTFSDIDEAIQKMDELTTIDYIEFLGVLRSTKLINKVDVLDLIDYDNQYSQSTLDPALAELSYKIRNELLHKASLSGEVALIANVARDVGEYRSMTQSLKQETTPERVHQLYLLADRLTRTGVVDLFKDEQGKALATRIGYNNNVIQSNLDVLNTMKANLPNFTLTQAKKELLQQEILRQSSLLLSTPDEQVRLLREWIEVTKDQDIIKKLDDFKVREAQRKTNAGKAIVNTVLTLLESGQQLEGFPKLLKELSDNGLIVLSSDAPLTADGVLDIDAIASVGPEFQKIDFKKFVDFAETRKIEKSAEEFDKAVDGLANEFFKYVYKNDSKKLEDMKKRLRKYILNNVRQLLPEDVAPYYQDKNITNVEEAIESISKAYEERKLVTNLEKSILESFKLTQELYDGKVASPITDKSNKITINFAEIQSKDITKFVSTLTNIAKSKDGTNTANDVNTAMAEVPGLVYALRNLNDLRRLYRNKSILTFDMDNENDQKALLNILSVLGFTKKDLDNYKFKNIPGIYVNKDTAGIYADKTHSSKYNNLETLLEKEMNGLIFRISETQVGASSDLTNIIEQVFPIGVGINESTVVQGDFVSLNFDITNAALNHVFKSIVAASKAGKAASKSEGAYGFLRETIGFDISNDDIQRLKDSGFFNYAILMGISESIDLHLTPNNPQLYIVNADPARAERLKAFGYTLSADNKMVTGFDTAKNKTWWNKQTLQQVDLLDVLPIKSLSEFSEFISGGSSAETFFKAFPDELESLVNVSNEGMITIPRRVKGKPVTVLEGETVGQLITRLTKTKATLVEEATLITLKSALAVSKRFSDFIDKYFKTKEEADSIKKFAKILNDEDVVKHIADNANLTNEDLADSISKLIDQKKVEATKSQLELKAKTKNGGFTDYRRNVIYATARSFLNMDSKVTASDVANFKKYLNIKSSEEFVNNYAKTEFDPKNKFLSLVRFDQSKEQFYIPVNNLLILRSEDLNAFLPGENRTLGGFIKDTFGEEFYNKIYSTSNVYDRLFISRTKKIKPDNLRLIQNKIGQNSNLITDQMTSLNYRVAKDMAINNAENKMMSDERVLADKDLLEVSELDTATQTQFKPYIDNIRKLYDTQGWNFNDTEGRNLISNMNNRIVQGMFFDNVISVQQTIKNGFEIGGRKIKLDLTPEDERMLALKIVSMANININKSRKTPYIILEVDDNLNKTNIKFISSDSKDEYDLLGGYLMGRIEKDNQRTYLLNIEEGFSLTTPTEKSSFLRAADITGFSKGSLLHEGPVSPSQFYQMLLRDVWIRGGKAQFKDEDDFTRQIRAGLFLKRTMNENKEDSINIIKKMYGPNSDTPLDEDFLNSAVSMFSRQSSEVSFGASELTLKEFALANTLEYENNNTIFSKQKEPLFNKRVRDVLMNGLDFYNLDSNIESTIEKLRDAFTELYDAEPKHIRQIVDSFYGSLISGNESIVKAGFNKKDLNYKVLTLVAMKYAVNKNDSDFLKYFLKNAHNGYSLLDLKQDKEKYLDRMGQVKIETKNDPIQIFDKNRKLNVTGLFMDNEWAFFTHENGESTPIGLFEIGYEIEGIEKFYKVKIDSSVYEAIKENYNTRNNSNRKFPEYTAFNTWLDQNNKRAAYENAYATGKPLSDVKDQIKADFITFKESFSDLVLFTHNGKGKGADIDALSNLGAEELTDYIKENIDHVDFLNDVLKKRNIVGDEETVYNKKNLNDIGQRLGLTTETHNALDDSKRLGEIVNRFDELLPEDTARTRMLKDINEIAKSLGLDYEDPKLFEYLNDNLKLNVNLTPEEINALNKYVKVEETITEEFVKSIIEQMNYLEHQREISHSAMQQYANLETKIYNAEDTINLMKGIDDAVVKKIKSVINALGTLFQKNYHSETTKNKMDYRVFLTKIANAIAKNYQSDSKALSNFKNFSTEIDDETGEVKETYHFNQYAFARFVDDIKNNSAESVLKKFTESNTYFGLKPEDKIEDLLKRSEETDNNYYKYLEENATSGENILKNYEKQRIQSKVYRKYANIINEMIIDPLEGYQHLNGLTKILVDKMFRFVGADSNVYKDEKTLLEAVKLLNNTVIHDSDLKTQLEKKFKEGFKNILTNQAMYSMFKTITPKMVKDLKLENNGIGTLVINKYAWKELTADAENKDGIDYETFKSANGLGKNDSVYMNVLRHPSDKYDTIHGYKVVVIDDGEQTFNAHLNKHELFTKHSGDFDGDHGTFFVPNQATQKFYNDRQVQDAILNPINKPIKILDNLLSIKRAEHVGTYVTNLDESEKKQRLIYDYVMRNDEIGKAILDLDQPLNKKDGSFNTKEAKKIIYENMIEQIRVGISKNGTEYTTDDVKKNFIRDDVIDKENIATGLYFVNNRYLINETGHLTKNIFSNFKDKSQIEEQIKLATFKTVVDLKDSITGYIEKLLVLNKNFGATKKPVYIAVKLDGEDFDILDKTFKTSDDKPLPITEVKKILLDAGMSEQIIQEYLGNYKGPVGAADVWNMLNIEQGFQRAQEEFKDAVTRASERIKGTLDYNSVRNEILNRNKGLAVYEKMVPKAYRNNYFFSGNNVTLKEQRMILDAYNSSLLKETYSGTQSAVTPEIAQKYLTKEKWLIVDGSGSNIKDENTAILNKKFADDKDNEIYSVVRTNRWDTGTQSVIEDRYKNGDRSLRKIGKPKFIGDYKLQTFGQKINKNVKLMALGTAAFGKITFSETEDFDVRFKDIQQALKIPSNEIAAMISAIDLKRLGESKAESPLIIEEKEVEVNGVKYKAYKVNIGISENENPWKNHVKPHAIDELSYIMNTNTIEAIPVFGDMAMQIKNGNVEFNTEKLQAIYKFRQKERDQFLSSPNFMSTLIQVRGIYAISWALKNKELFTPGQLDILNNYKSIYYQVGDKNKLGPSSNFVGDLPALNDLLFMIDDASGNRFSTDIKNSPIAKRWFNDDLIEKAFITTFDLYDTSDLENVKIDNKTFNVDQYKFIGRKAQKNTLDKLYKSQTVPAKMVGRIVDMNAGGSTPIQFKLSTAEAMKMLLPPGESLSNADILRFMANGLGNYGDVVNGQMGLGFESTDRNDFTEQYIEPSIHAAKSGLDAGEIAAQLIRPNGRSYGVSGVVPDKDNVFFKKLGQPKAYEEMRLALGESQDKDHPNRLNNGLMWKDENGVMRYTTSSNKNLLNKLLAITNNKNLADRVLQFHEVKPEKIVGFVNSKQWSANPDGSISLKYHTDAPIEAVNYEDYIQKVYKRLSTDTYIKNKEYVDEQINETEVNKITAEQAKAFEDYEEKQQEKRKEKLESLQPYLEKSFSREQFLRLEQEKQNIISDQVAGTKYVEKEIEQTRKHFARHIEGDVKNTNPKVNLLENIGLQAKTPEEFKAVQAIQNMIGFQHFYEAEMNSTLKHIRELTEGVAGLSTEFDLFTKLRVLELEMKEAQNDKTKSDILIEHVENEYRKLGFNQESAAKFIANFNNNGVNQPLIALYHKAMANIIDMSRDLGKHFGIAENFGELFLLKQLVKKGKNNNSNKKSYFSTMNTLFLNQEKTAEDMILYATEYSFAESLYGISKNLSKMRAILDVREQYKSSGVIDNVTILNNTNMEFEKALDALAEKEQVYFKEIELRKNLKNYLSKYTIEYSTNINEESKTFYKDMYTELNKNIQYTIDTYDLSINYKDMSISELLDTYQKMDINNPERNAIFMLMKDKQAMIDFKVEVINLNPGIAKKISKNLNVIAEMNNARITNEWMQLLPNESRSSFNFIAGADFATLKRNADYYLSGDTEEQRLAYMAVTGNLYLTNKTVADHLDKYFYTQKLPTEVENILNVTKRSFAKFVMSMPHKLVNRMTQYSIGDVALITATDPSSVKDIIPSMNELSGFYQSKGASATPELLKFLKLMGATPGAESKKSLNLDTMERTEIKELGKGYFKFVGDVFEYQTLAGRYALYKSLLKRFNDYDADPSKDKRLYGPLYSQKKFIDELDSNEEKAREITYATIGGPNGFPLIARKQLQNWGMFLTYPLALLRTGIGHSKSIGASLVEVAKGQTNSSTIKYLLTTTGSLVGTALIVAMANALIADHYNVDEETKEEWMKQQVYIDPFLSFINDRPVVLQGGSTGILAQFREMFYEPFEKADNDLVDGSVNWINANVLARLNPLVKTPLELISGKDFWGNYGPKDNTQNSVINNMARKTLSMFIGASGANAMVDEWKYTEAYDEDPNFIQRLSYSVTEAFKGEAGNYRGYKSEQKNYFKALEMIRGFKQIENSDYNFTNYADTGYNGEDMYQLSYNIKKALDKNQPASVVYAIINEAILDGVSASTIKSAIFNNSITGKLSQIDNFDVFYKSLDPKGQAILNDAIKYEENQYSILKGLVKDYISAKSNGYVKKAYVKKNYISYEPYYSYNDYRNGKNATNTFNKRFNGSQYRKYASDYIAYRQKNNFVPSLSDFTGRYGAINVSKKMKAYQPRKEYNRDYVKARKYYNED